jgi:hypothetical protein
MGILGKLFGSEKVIDGGMKAIDKAFYTKEEKADDRIKIMNAKGLLLKSYEAFKLAQRLLALLYGIPYVTAWFCTFVASFFVDVKSQFEFLISSDMATANLIILGFYFLGGAGESIFKYRGVKK